MAPAGGPPQLINPYAGDDPESRPSRSAVAAGRALAAGAIGFGAVALLSGTAAADEDAAADPGTSEQSDEQRAEREQQRAEERALRDEQRRIERAEREGQRAEERVLREEQRAEERALRVEQRAGREAQRAERGEDRDVAGEQEVALDSSPPSDDNTPRLTLQQFDPSAAEVIDLSDAEFSVPQGDSSDASRTPLDRIEITLPPEARQRIDDERTAREIDGTRELPDVPVNGESPVARDGALEVIAPGIDTENTRFANDGGNVSVEGTRASLGGVRVRTGDRDESTGLTGRHETTLRLDQQELNLDLGAQPDRAERPDNIAFDSRSWVGFTDGTFRPAEAPTGGGSESWRGFRAGLGVNAAGTVMNTEDGDPAVTGNASGAFEIGAQAGTDQPDRGRDAAFSLRYAPIEVQFGPRGSDRTSSLDIGGRLGFRDGPRLGPDRLPETPGVTLQGDLGARFAMRTGSEVPVPRSTRTTEVDQMQGEVRGNLSLAARESVRPQDGGPDVDASAAANLTGGFAVNETRSEFGTQSNNGLFGSAGIRGDLAVGDRSGPRQLSGRLSADASVNHDPTNGTTTDGGLRVGVEGRWDDLTGEIGQNWRLDGSSGIDATGTWEDAAGDVDIQVQYDGVDGSRVSIGPVFNGRNERPVDRAAATERPSTDDSTPPDGPQEQPSFDAGDDLRLASDVRLGETPPEIPLPLSIDTSSPGGATPPSADTQTPDPVPGESQGTAADLLPPAPVTTAPEATAPATTPEPAPEPTAPAPAATPDPAPVPAEVPAPLPVPTDLSNDFSIDRSVTLTPVTIGDIGGGSVIDVTSPDVGLGTMASPALDNLVAGAGAVPTAPVLVEPVGVPAPLPAPTPPPVLDPAPAPVPAPEPAPAPAPAPEPAPAPAPAPEPAPEADPAAAVPPAPRFVRNPMTSFLEPAAFTDATDFTIDNGTTLSQFPIRNLGPSLHDLGRPGDTFSFTPATFSFGGGF